MRQNQMWINLEEPFFAITLKEQSQRDCHIFKTGDIPKTGRKLEP